MDRTERTAVLKAQSRVLATAGLIGVPVSFAAFVFLALLHQFTGFVWEDLPERLGLGTLPWWWPAPWLAVGGLLVGIAVRYLPGRGGHVPLEGLGTEPVPPSHTPGILLAALGGLPLGAVLGPEAPLIAVGSAAATALTHRWGPRRDTPEHAVLSAAGAASAIAVIFGSPLIAAVFIVESAAATGHRRTRIVLPCLLASGIGALIFTGLGSWTGFEIASLALPEISGPLELGLTDILWTVPAAIAIAYAVKQLHRLGHWFESHSIRRQGAAAVLAGLSVAACAGAYALLTGRSPVEVALSGQETLADVAAEPEAWTAGALVALLVFKGLAYGVSLAALRGGPIFPALFLGAAAGLLMSGLPGFGTVPALAAGMAAATTAILPLPVSSAVLVTLLLGPASVSMTPIVLVAVVVAYVSEQALDRYSAVEAESPA